MSALYGPQEEKNEIPPEKKFMGVVFVTSKMSFIAAFCALSTTSELEDASLA